MSYSVILPTLNEKGHIVNLINQICKIFKNSKKLFEIIVVDDNSVDGTQYLLKKCARNNKFIKLIQRKKKRNLANSIQEGINMAKYKYLIWMDADFQHPPKYIYNFINYKNEKKLLICSRFLKGSKRYFEVNKKIKNINENQSIFFNRLCKFFLFDNITDYTSGYICINKNFLKDYKLNGFYGEYFLNLICHLKKKNYNVVEIPFIDSLRKSGTSKTIENFNFKYFYTCFRYFISLKLNILDILLWRMFNKIYKFYKS